jgi:hypothetical protein
MGDDTGGARIAVMARTNLLQGCYNLVDGPAAETGVETPVYTDETQLRGLSHGWSNYSG